MINEALSKLSVTPYAYQIEGASFLLRHEYAMAAAEMGLGKTLMAIVVHVAMSLSNPKNRTLVVCPAMLKVNWLREFSKFANIDASLVNKKDEARATALNEQNKVVIVNYEQLPVLLGACKFDYVVFDECHYLGNPHSQRTSKATSLVERMVPKRLSLLTGTPIKNRVIELYPLFKLMSLKAGTPNGAPVQSRFGSHLQFCQTLCHQREVYEMGKRGIKFEGLKNEQALNLLMDKKVIRHMAEDCLDLPEMNFSTIEVPYPENEMDLEQKQKEYGDEWAAFLKYGEPKYLSSKKKWAAMLKMPMTAARVKAIIDAGLGPVLVFSDHVDTCYGIVDMLNDDTDIADYITGAVTMSKRQKIIDAFQSGKLQVLCASIPTLQAGVNLTASNRLIFNDLPWEPAAYLQAIKRIHRIGQNKKCFIETIAFSGIDASIAGTIMNKSRTINRALAYVEKTTREGDYGEFS